YEITPAIINLNSNSIAYVDGALGNDLNNGDKLTPLKTISAAIDSGKDTIIISGGVYRESINLSGVNKVKLIGKTNESVNVFGSNKITDFSLTEGKTNVYEASLSD